MWNYRYVPNLRWHSLSIQGSLNATSLHNMKEVVPIYLWNQEQETTELVLNLNKNNEFLYGPK
jgi:hypothetical protein